jgi:hypothetical protein
MSESASGHSTRPYRSAIAEIQREIWSVLATPGAYDAINISGHIFVTACQLGGQLQSSKFAGSLTELKDIQKQDALKSEMGINFNAQYASGSINYGKQRQTGTQDFTGRGVDVSSLAWTARGGNSLLCAKSVAPNSFWGSC